MNSTCSGPQTQPRPHLCTHPDPFYINGFLFFFFFYLQLLLGESNNYLKTRLSLTRHAASETGDRHVSISISTEVRSKQNGLETCLCEACIRRYVCVCHRIISDYIYKGRGGEGGQLKGNPYTATRKSESCQSA